MESIVPQQEIQRTLRTRTPITILKSNGKPKGTSASAQFSRDILSLKLESGRSKRNIRSPIAIYEPIIQHPKKRKRLESSNVVLNVDVPQVAHSSVEPNQLSDLLINQPSEERSYLIRQILDGMHQRMKRKGTSKPIEFRLNTFWKSQCLVLGDSLSNLNLDTEESLRNLFGACSLEKSFRQLQGKAKVVPPLSISSTITEKNQRLRIRFIYEVTTDKDPIPLQGMYRPEFPRNSIGADSSFNNVVIDI